MRGIVGIAFVILGVSGLVAAQGRDDKPGSRQHRTGRTHFGGSKNLTGKNTPSGNSGSNSSDSGSMNFKPVLGGTPPAGGNGGNGPTGGPSGGNPPGGNPPGGNPPGGNPPGGNPPGGNPPGGNPPGGNPGGPDSPPTWGGPIGGGPSDPPAHTVPEIDPASGMSALTMLSGALVVMRGRRKKDS
jgi:hypothetical protein